MKTSLKRCLGILLGISVILWQTPSFGEISPEGEKPSSEASPEERPGMPTLLPLKEEDTKPFALDEILVKFKPAASRQIRESALEKVAVRVHHFEDQNKGPKGQRGPEVFDQLVHVKIKTDRSLQAVLAELKSDPAVEYAEPNYYVHTLATFPNDLDFSKLWGLHNTGQTGGKVDADIDAPEAWDLETGNPQVVVAVIDTGVDSTHPDLAKNIWVNPGEIPGNKIDDDGNGYVDDVYGYDFVNNDPDPKDDNFHGTHVAGTIGAVGNNGVGVTGVCWKVKLMALKFLNAGGGGTESGAILAIQYATNNGAHIMSNSWGGGVFSQALQDAITAANNAGILCVAAAGNANSSQPLYPAAMTGVVAVSATDHTDAKAFFSNFGTYIDLAAPGVNIYSTFPTYATSAMSSRGLPTYYGTISGTSMACPHVSGLAALIKSHNLGLSNAQLQSVLQNSTDDLGLAGWDEIYGWGRINASKALASMVATPPSIVEILSPPNGATISSAGINITGTATGNGFASYRLEYAASQDTSWRLLKFSTTPVTAGLLASLDLTTFPDGPIALRLTLTDTSGKSYRTVNLVVLENFTTVLSLPKTSVPKKGGPVSIKGTAKVNAFTLDHYVLEYGFGLSPTIWSQTGFVLSGGGTLPVENGILGTFDVSSLSEGFYTIRVTVFSSLGRSESVADLIYVDPYLKPGWPIVTPGYTKDFFPHSVGDLDGIPGKEILLSTTGSFSTIRGILAYNASGGSVFSIKDDNIRSSAALAELAVTSGMEYGYVQRRVFGESLFALSAANQNGVLSGFPKALPWTIIGNVNWTTTPLAKDLDGDGNEDIILPTTTLVSYQTLSGKSTYRVYLHAWDRSGAYLPGFPFLYEATDTYQYGGVFFNGAVGDVDGDGHPEIFFSVHMIPLTVGPVGGTKVLLFGIDHQGKLIPGFPKTFTRLGILQKWATLQGPRGEIYLSNIAIADLDGKGQKEVVFVETSFGEQKNGSFLYRLAVHAIHKDGTYQLGWPFKLEGSLATVGNKVPRLGGMLVLGDVTGDGLPEVVVSANPGFPVVDPTAPSIRVLGGDGKQIYTISTALVSADGLAPSSWDAHGISIVDLDGDNKGEILFTRPMVNPTSTASLYPRLPGIFAYSGTTPIIRLIAMPVSNGTSLEMPVNLSGVGPIVDDLDPDGKLDLVEAYSSGVTWEGILYSWTLPYTYANSKMEWPMYQVSPARTGEYVPRPKRP